MIKVLLGFPLYIENKNSRLIKQFEACLIAAMTHKLHITHTIK